MKFNVDTLIDCAPESIWKILTSTQALVSGDLGIIKIEGDIQLGSRIKLWAEVSPNRAFNLKIAELEPYKRMVWSSGMPLGLFKGVRTFTLSPEGGKTRFSMDEEFSGLMLPLIAKSIPDLNPAFKQFSDGLKKLCAA